MKDSPRYYRIVTRTYKDDKMFLWNPEVIFFSDNDIFYDVYGVREEQNTFINMKNTLRFGIKEQNRFWKW